jgi:hypothetical protein
MLCGAAFVGIGLTGCASAGETPTGGRPPSDGDSSERAAAVPPVYALLGEREAVGLTSSQIAALDSIATWLSSTNAPLIEDLFERGIRRDDDAVRREADPPRADRDGRPLIREIGANNLAAEAAIQGLLTEDQQSRVCTVFSRSGTDRLSSVPRGTARLGVAPGFGAPDVVNYRWPWCESEEDSQSGDDADTA